MLKLDSFERFERQVQHHVIGLHAQVIGEDDNGLLDMNQLELELRRHQDAPLIVGSFTAGSNVTGIAPDVHSIASLLHQYGALAAFDFASAGSSKEVCLTAFCLIV